MSSLAMPSAELVDITDTKQLRGAFGAFPTGVTVVTVGGTVPRGMTANSFTAVSLAPPLVLVCVTKDAVMHRSLDRAPTFSISVLAAGQEAAARHFANHSRPAGAGQFDTIGCRAGHLCDAPLIGGSVAHFECEKWQLYDGGDHTIFLGKVLRAERRPGQDALLFNNGQFRQFAPESGKGRAA